MDNSIKGECLTFLKKSNDASWEKLNNVDYGVKIYTKERSGNKVDINNETQEIETQEVETQETQDKEVSSQESEQSVGHIAGQGDTQNNTDLAAQNKKAESANNNELITLLDKEADSKDEKDSIIMIAHRGMSSLAPENTIPAMEMAGLYGYQSVEFDVYQTKDGKFVISHDLDVSRMTNGKGKITKLTLEQIKKFNIDNGQGIENYKNLKIPTLEEVLACCNEYNLIPSIEIKDVKNIKALLKIVDKYGFLQTAKISSQKESVLKAVRKNNQSISTSLISDGDGFEAVNKALRLKCNGINLYYKSLNDEVAAYAKKNNLEIIVWNVNHLSVEEQCRKWQVDYITTNGIT
ncbi:hypothetical protein CG709_17270 [Lachnotalea glycerini]|nr:hypothetical protein CG709_17270 [Lachnotalea glycerini]